MSTLVPALIASTLLSIATVPITTLSLQSARTRVSSQLFHEAETLALNVRKDVALAGEMEITSAGVLVLDGRPMQLDDRCSVSPIPYVERQNTEIATVTCTASRGPLRQRNTQPLFTYSTLQRPNAERLAEKMQEEAISADKVRIQNNQIQTYRNGTWTTHTLPSECTVAASTIASRVLIPSVTCTSGAGATQERFTKLLFSKENLIISSEAHSGYGSNPGLCYSRYRSQSSSNRDDRLYTAAISVEEFNSFLQEPGNSEGFLQIHPISDSGCQQAINNGDPRGDEDSASEHNDNDHDREGRCTVGHYLGTLFERDPDDQRWNTKDDGEIKSSHWTPSRKVVISQEPAPNTNHDCDDDIDLEFKQ